MIRISDIVALERARQATEYGRRLIAQDETLRRLSLIWSIVLAVSTTVAVYAQLAGVPVPSAAIAGIASMLSVAAVAYIYADHAARKDKLDATWHEAAAVDRQQITAMQAQSEDTQRQVLAELGRMRAAERARQEEWEKGAKHARDRDALLSHMFTELAHLRAAELERLAVGLADLVKAVDHHVGVIELMARDIEALETRCDQMQEIKQAAGVLRESRNELLLHMAAMVEDAVARAYKTGREEGAHNPDPEVLRQMQWEAYTDVLEDLGGLTPPPAPSE
jgi:hypothetical protein